ncbi:hypothetical protein OIA45_48605 (plasmid) [Streptomyces chartreusis]|uniref:hypothetical protein n=1 Tax=Streptomyces chartreusis TaxID=1969 RepID=UPI0037DCF365|nr:hypothetical protein OIA45_48605 [Streptomyces chartreusis]
MQNGIRQTTIRRDTPQTSGSFETATSHPAELGPRAEGVEYVTGNGAFRVLDVVTDRSEARRILKRHSARFAVLVRDLHAGTEHYTGAVWTGSDRVLKAVTV